jgi:hypothetical protein
MAKLRRRPAPKQRAVEVEDPQERSVNEMLASLTPKQRKLVEGYVAHGHARRAAKEAGYKGTEHGLSSIAWQTLSLPYVAEILNAMIETDPKVVGRAERLHIRSTIARDPKQPASVRLAALDSLDKVQGKFVDRHEHSGPGGGPIDVRMELEQLSSEQLRKIAEEADVAEV